MEPEQPSKEVSSREEDAGAAREPFAPGRYWGRKRLLHVCLGLGLVLVCAGYAIFCASYLGGLHKAATTELTEPTTQPPNRPLYALAPFVAAATFLLWGFNLLIKLLLMQMRLWADAAERVIAWQTFCDILDGKLPLTEKERQVLLAVVFNSATSTVIGDKEALSGGSKALLTALGRP